MWAKSQPRKKKLLTSLGAGVVTLAVFYFLLIPQYDEYINNRKTLAELKARVGEAEQLLASEQVELELAVQAGVELDAVKPLFNNQLTDGLAVAHIGREANRTGVRIDTFVPAGIVNQGTYLELPVKFVVSGDYLNVVTFIDHLGELTNLAELRSLNIQPAKEVVTTVEAAVENLNKKQAPVSNVQSGRVMAEFELVLYSAVAPEATLKIEQANGIQQGRPNAFQTPAGVATPAERH